jgi:outer membrane PBP1 activator LpoA protein
MNIQSRSGEYNSDTIVAFPPGAKDGTLDNVDQLDKAGQTILKLLHKAASVAEENSRQALDIAQKFSHQLRAAEDRIAELQAEIDLYREKCDRAEHWLHKVYTEIEERFLRQDEGRRSMQRAVGPRA